MDHGLKWNMTKHVRLLEKDKGENLKDHRLGK